MRSCRVNLGTPVTGLLTARCAKPHGERHSCTHQPLRVTIKIVDGFNVKHYNGVVSLDVRKAFDRMWHHGLIVKLITYKFPDYLILILRNSEPTGNSKSVSITLSPQWATYKQGDHKEAPSARLS
ncbi:hypothetical protein AVEN_200189-1 [Araneus ventricosus]|uniref:Uncharacterized protein n=1 Tax=Araneus ventricosus TaxID=182803 RepID=A0A4Y2MDC8_ARAVE|nr:hypothetical protein AVEN_200189-1 [Araneus ventricosus]